MIKYNDFIIQVTKAHDELQELLHMVSCEELPKLAANMINESEIVDMSEAMDVLKKMMEKADAIRQNYRK